MTFQHEYTYVSFLCSYVFETFIYKIGQCCGAVSSIANLQLQGSQYDRELCLLSVHVLLVIAWVSSRFFSFHPLSKNMPVGGLVMLNCPYV